MSQATSEQSLFRLRSRRFAGHAWLYYVFMMPATASLNATTLTQVGQLGEQRLIDNVVGGLLVLLAAAATIGYSNWATRHGQAGDEEEAKQLAAVPSASPTPRVPSNRRVSVMSRIAVRVF